MPDVGGSNFLRPTPPSPLASPNNSNVRLSPAPAPVSWTRLIAGHVLALVPAVVVIGLTLWSSYVAIDLCDMKLLYPDADSESCSPVMSFGVMMLLIIIGAISWHTAYALRPICWEVTFFIAKVLFVLPYGWIFDSRIFDETVSILTGLSSAFLRSIVVESLRLFGQEICVVVVVALAWQQHNIELVHQPQQNFLTVSKARKDELMCEIGVDDPRFAIALWLGTGWAIAELVAGSYQLCKFLPLFRSIIRIPSLDEEDLLTDFVQPTPDTADASDQVSNTPLASYPPDPEADDDADEEEMPLDEIILVREKAELEEQLGEVLENVSLATITLWRLDSVLWDVGCTLILSASLTRAQGCLGDPTTQESQYAFLPFPPLANIWKTVAVLVLMRTLATTVWMALIPRLGLVSITYTTMLVGLALLVVGLGSWGALA
ncbi:hypothetical protein MYAM1_003488 [Malassezia yamatoensis]|uniref:Uncharacterized protein n=1 Tax=Malassezia yamatoensis TaxID=253288 RepID=A0AAJ6CIY0_9BASI|nr:hypothetical protein MYAM1_003488 [Malassezia yamatoensis]